MKKKYQVKYNLITMNVVGAIYTAIICLITYLLFKTDIGLNFPTFDTERLTLQLVVILGLYILWTILHELIHGIFYCVGGAKWKNISFGAALEKGILYCKCCKPITKKNAMISLQAPLVIIGIITYFISLLIGSYTLLFLSIANIYGACGDIIVFIFFTKLPKDTMFKEIGDTSTFMLESKDDLTRIKCLGIKEISLIDDEKQFEEKNIKKIDISKTSIFIFLFLLFIIILDIIIALI